MLITEIRPSGITITSLSQSESCILCLNPVPERQRVIDDLLLEGYSKKTVHRMVRGLNYRTRDHLFPSVSCLRHGSSALYKVMEIDDNLVTVCLKDHRREDRRKIKAFYSGGKKAGLTQLVEQVAKYRRSPDPELLVVQREQFVRLFDTVLTNIKRLNGNTPKDYQEDYGTAKISLLTYLDLWSGGNF